MDKLKARLSAERGALLTDADVHLWLRRAGFSLQGDWACDSAALAALAPDEVLEAKVYETEGGITFVRIEHRGRRGGPGRAARPRGPSGSDQ